MPSPRTSSLLLALVLLPAFACDKGADKKTDDKKVDDKKADDKAAEKAEDKPAEKKLEWTWKASDVTGAMKMGTTLTYKQTGKDAKGKAVEDDYRCVIKSASGSDVGTVCNGVNHPSEDKGANEVATAEWSAYSPFFSVSQPKVELMERADLTVPAGTFDTVKADLQGFFGNHYTVWMIADKPGIYAKVQKHPNAGTEDDQTDMVFELAAME